MKDFYYLFLLSFTLFFTSTALPQIAEITRLPVQNPEQSMKESAPIWISGSEIIIFYVSPTLDTIYSTRSDDGYYLASGVYIYKMKVNDPETSSGQGFIQSKKMVLIR